jgi:hypothetical protein
MRATTQAADTRASRADSATAWAPGVIAAETLTHRDRPGGELAAQS